MDRAKSGFVVNYDIEIIKSGHPGNLYIYIYIDIYIDI